MTTSSVCLQCGSEEVRRRGVHAQQDEGELRSAASSGAGSPS